MENSPSGLWRTLGKRVGVTASRVRISYSPPVGLSEQSESLFFFLSKTFRQGGLVRLDMTVIPGYRVIRTKRGA